MGAGLITLLCLSEALAIARSIAAHTRQRLNVNQELIGQGLANLAGCCTQSFVVSGSFSRSAVNLNAGARTGMASVITSLMVVITLLWLTPLLEGLPEATLAAIIIISVLSLIKVQPFVETWRVSRQDGAVAIVTFVATLVVAPNLEYGIFTGVGLSLVLFLYRTMYPHVALLARHPDGTLRDLRVRHLQACRHIAVVRFDGQLYFGNCSFFEDKVLDTIAGNTEMRTVILDAAGINRIDASGEFTLRAVAQHLREAGIVFLIARGKHAFLRTLERAGFTALLGRDRFFHRTEDAIEYAWRDMNCNHVSQCPLYQPLPVAPATAPPA
jgi:SulP family sulfate permease